MGAGIGDGEGGGVGRKSTASTGNALDGDEALEAEGGGVGTDVGSVCVAALCSAGRAGCDMASDAGDTVQPGAGATASARRSIDGAAAVAGEVTKPGGGAIAAAVWLVISMPGGGNSGMETALCSAADCCATAFARPAAETGAGREGFRGLATGTGAQGARGAVAGASLCSDAGLDTGTLRRARSSILKATRSCASEQAGSLDVKRPTGR